MIAVISLFLARDFFRPGLPMSHDGLSHAARLASFWQSLSEGNLVPRWGAELNAGYGHPVLMFLYPLTNYLGAGFHLLGFSFVDSVKLVFVCGYLVSGWGAYLWFKELSDSKTAFWGALLYQIAPYRGVDLLVRGALGETTALALVPWVGLGLTKLIKTQSRVWFLLTAASCALLVLAHNALAPVFSFVLGGFAAIQIWFSPARRWPQTILTFLALGLGLGMAAFFWIPAYGEGKYTLRDMVIGPDLVANRFLKFSQLVALPWQGLTDPDFTPNLGPLSVFFLLFSWGVLLLRAGRRRQFLVSFWLLAWFNLVTLFSVFLMLPVSRPVWQKVSLLQKFQFPWRFLAVPVLTIPASLAVISQLMGRRRFLIVVSAITLISYLMALPLFKAPGFKNYPDGFFFTGYLGTTDTGESSPRWSVRGMEKRPSSPVEVISGQAQIKWGPRSTTKHDFTVMAKTEARIQDNTLYFPGWQVLVDDRPAAIEFQDPNHRGLITFNVPSGRHQVLVEFKETKLRYGADLIALISWLTFGLVTLIAMGLGRFKKFR